MAYMYSACRTNESNAHEHWSTRKMLEIKSFAIDVRVGVTLLFNRAIHLSLLSVVAAISDDAQPLLNPMRSPFLSLSRTLSISLSPSIFIIDTLFKYNLIYGCCLGTIFAYCSNMHFDIKPQLIALSIGFINKIYAFIKFKEILQYSSIRHVHLKWNDFDSICHHVFIIFEMASNEQITNKWNVWYYNRQTMVAI